MRKIQIEDMQASIRCGGLTAQLSVDPWYHVARIAFYNVNDDLLLREITCGGALNLRSRRLNRS